MGTTRRSGGGHAATTYWHPVAPVLSRRSVAADASRRKVWAWS